jgi:hypothetical protein
MENGRPDRAKPKAKTCSICGGPAIGTQIFGCCAWDVCAEHADPRLRALKPGERFAGGDCYLVRDDAPAGEP